MSYNISLGSDRMQLFRDNGFDEDRRGIASVGLFSNYVLQDDVYEKLARMKQLFDVDLGTQRRSPERQVERQLTPQERYNLAWQRNQRERGV